MQAGARPRVLGLHLRPWERQPGLGPEHAFLLAGMPAGHPPWTTARLSGGDRSLVVRVHLVALSSGAGQITAKWTVS